MAEYLLDNICNELAESIREPLMLDNSFGRAERLTRLNMDGKRIYTANVYNGDETHGNEYTEVMPSDSLGNYAFFFAHDPEEVDNTDGVSVGVKATVSLILWYDCRKMYDALNVRSRDAVKAKVLDVLNGGVTTRTGHFRVGKVYELAANIWRGFSYDEIDNQFLMHPYCGFRFEGQMTVHQNCHIDGRSYN